MASLDLSKTNQYTLSIRISHTNGFCFYVYSPLDDLSETTTFELDSELSIVENLRIAFLRTNYMQFAFKKVQVCIEAKEFVVLPDEEEEEKELYDMFNSLFGEAKNVEILQDSLSLVGVRVCHRLDRRVREVIEEFLPSCEIYSDVSRFLTYYSAKSKVGNNKKMYVLLSEQDFTVMCFERGKLLLINKFDCTNNNDRLYFMMSVWKHLSFNQERDELHIYGSCFERNELIERAKRFVVQVVVALDENVDLC